MFLTSEIPQGWQPFPGYRIVGAGFVLSNVGGGDACIMVCIFLQCLPIIIMERLTIESNAFVRSSVRPSVRPFVRPFVRQSIRTPIRPSVHTYAHTSVRPYVRQYLRPSIRTPIRAFVPAFRNDLEASLVWVN